jgi:hypothetical protein
MRYNLESTLPIHAFQPLGGKHNPFKQRMTLEGGNPVSAVTDTISKGLGTDGGGGGVLGALATVDKAVGDVIPGGWATVAAVAVPYAAPYLTGAALTAGQAAALAAGTSATTSAIQGKNLEDTLKAAALAGATSYGLSSLSSANELDSLALPSNTPYVDLPDDAVLLSGGAPDLSGISLPSETPYVDLADEGTLLSSGPSSAIQSNELPSDVIDLPDTGTSYSNLPAELNLDALYQDMPDGINQFSPVSQETIAASASQPTLTPEEKLELLVKNAQDTGVQPSISYDSDTGVKVTDFSTPASEETQRMVDMGILERTSEMPEYIYEAIKRNPTLAAALGLGALTLAGDKGQPQQEGQSEPTKRTYSYGTSRAVADPYLIRNTANARSVYEPRYAKGGEVKRFGIGGLSNALTRVFQPIERAVIQPIGQAAPFLKDVAPYAGILAAPFIANPFAAAGVGALSSGFGRPGTGFNMKRALMGGIAAYGASTAGAGLEAAGTEPATTAATTTSNLVSTPPGTVGESLVNQTSSLVKDPSTGFFRDTSAMQRGVGSLLGSDSKAAAARFGTQAGTFKSGVPIVMGISGMSAIDEAQKMQEEADIASAPARQANVDMLARIAASKERAKKAVLENPYQFAEGGSVDDEKGSDYYSTDQGNLNKGLFGLGYAAGGIAGYASGGVIRYAEGGATNESVISQIYQDQLGRAPDSEGLAYWSSELAKGVPLSQISQAINQSKEGEDFDTQFGASLYRKYFGRNPEQAGYQYWLSEAQAKGYTPAEIENIFKIAAQPEQQQKGITPDKVFTEMEIAALEADPSAGRYATRSIYDLLPDAVNVSQIGDRKVQFVNPVTQRPYITSYGKDGSEFSQEQGSPVFNTAAAQAEIDRALASGAMSTTEYNTLMNELKNPELTVDEFYAAVNRPQSKLVIDPKYGLQIGEANTLEEALAEGEQRQAVLTANDPGYYVNNFTLAQQYEDAGLYYPFGPEAYTGYDTRTGEKDLLTDANVAQMGLEFANANPYLISNAVNAENVYTFDQPQAVQALGLAQLAPQTDVNSTSIYAPEQTAPTGMASGGVARFLSGGGDGMSDSIRANIEGTQEARLADGEFVIPADVVSHLGNGSSKAGAKQLYSMMDRVRKARTGNQKQGRQIKPMKLMPA